MREAFKEWAIVVDALGCGQQIIILRKGGIAENRGGFAVEHRKFWLFSTLFHQQRDAVIESAQTRFDQIAPNLPAADRVRVEFFAEAAAWHQLDSLESVRRLRGLHIWRDDVIAERFEWGRAPNIFVIAVRVHRMRSPVELPMLPAYGGCKSWIDLETDLPIAGAEPVIEPATFAVRLKDFEGRVSAETIH